MKRSEFEKKRRSFWQTETDPDLTTLVNRDVWAAEAAGVVWDPEEEPLPRTLWFGPSDGSVGAGAPDSYHIWNVGYDDCGRDRRYRISQEAVRRWNAWPELRKVVDAWKPGTKTSIATAQRLKAILDGKEGG